MRQREADLKTPRKIYHRRAERFLDMAFSITLVAFNDSGIFANLAIDRLAGFFIYQNFFNNFSFIVFPDWLDAIFAGNDTLPDAHRTRLYLVPVDFPRTIFKCAKCRGNVEASAVIIGGGFKSTRPSFSSSLSK